MKAFLDDDRFIANLNERLESFNMFDALNASNQEIKHSNFLAWIFNPKANHGQKTEFLAALIALIKEQANTAAVGSITKAGLSSVRVEPEYKGISPKRIDLVLVFEKAEQVLVIENKIHASQRRNQLTDYREKIENDPAFAGYRKTYVFLTLKNEAPDDPAYLPITYSDLSAAFLKRTKSHAMSDEGALAILLRHYLDLLSGMDTGFNVFAALRATRKELRHSDFLAWCFDPSSNRRLADRMLRQLLRSIPALREEAEAEDMSDLEVCRERENIDILLISERNRFVCAIENKWESGESPGQLSSYRKFVEAQYPEFRKSFVFLTRKAQQPSDEAYHRLSYDDIRTIFADAVASLPSVKPDAQAETLIFIDHYLKLVRSQLKAADKAKYLFAPEVENLVRMLWQKHSRELGSLIVGVQQWQKSVQDELEAFLWQLADKHFPGCYLSRSTIQRVWLRFIPADMSDLPHFQKSSENDELKHCMPHYTFHNLPFGYEDVPHASNAGLEKSGVILTLGIAKAYKGKEGLRSAIYEEARADRKIFNSARTEKPRGIRFTTLLTHTLASRRDVIERDLDDLKQVIATRFKRFIDYQHDRVMSLLDAESVRNA